MKYKRESSSKKKEAQHYCSSDYNGAPISCSADITYKAGEKIILKPGFKVDAGAHFVARIVPMPGLCQPIPGLYDFSQFPDIGNTETMTGDLRISIYTPGTKLMAFEDNRKQNASDASVIVFPNPAEDILNIETLLENYSVKVYNQLGQIEITKCNLSGNYSLMLNNLPSGFYYITIANSSSFCKTEKILIKSSF